LIVAGRQLIGEWGSGQLFCFDARRGKVNLPQVKKCTWCGKEYPDEAKLCSIDQQPLEGGEPPPAEPVPREAERAPGPSAGAISGTPRRLWLTEVDATWRPKILELDKIESAFTFVEGYSRADWKVIRQAIDGVSPEDSADAWADAAVQWIQRLAADLGGGYRITCSNEFILLSALPLAESEKLLIFAERTLEHIYATLKEATWQWGHGKHVVLLFGESDDYYQYVSYYDKDGVHPTSSGCLIHKDYVHIAMPYLNGRTIRQALTHELLHNSVVHLRLPLWLNEGLAVVFDRTASAWQRPIVDHELRDRHLAFWNEQNIQKFWAGVSFGEPGDSNELSYSLAQIMVELLLSDSKDFVPFLKEANWNDAGQTAALEILGTDLGQMMGTFLGPGNWRPRRKALVECWNAAKPKESA
jgi:hypothetical protein